MGRSVFLACFLPQNNYLQLLALDPLLICIWPASNYFWITCMPQKTRIWALSDSFLMHFWSVLGMWLGFFASNFHDFSSKFMISSNFPGLRYMIFSKNYTFFERSTFVFAMFPDLFTNALMLIWRRSRSVFASFLKQFLARNTWFTEFF